MAQGTVKWFNNTKKYGFILTDEGKEVFVHFSEIEAEGYKTLKKGDEVEFTLVSTPRGDKAVQVKKKEPSDKKVRPKEAKKPERRLNSDDSFDGLVYKRGIWIDPSKN